MISSDWDKEIDWSVLAEKLSNNLKQSGTLIMFGKQPMLVEAYNGFKEYFDFRFEYIWEKQNMMWVSDYQPLPVHENIWVFSHKNIKVSNLTFNIEAISRKGGYIRHGKTSPSETRSNLKPVENVEKDYRMPRSVQKFGNMTVLPKERLGHPTQKPEKIINFLMRGHSNKDDWVYDPFMGSGTTMKVAQDLGRNCVGIELLEKYCNMIKNRCFTRTFLDREVSYEFINTQ